MFTTVLSAIYNCTLSIIIVKLPWQPFDIEFYTQPTALSTKSVYLLLNGFKLKVEEVCQLKLGKNIMIVGMFHNRLQKYVFFFFRFS